MAASSAKIRESIAILKEFFTTIDKVTLETMQSLESLETALNRISTGKFAGGLQGIASNFNQIATASASTTEQIDKAAAALQTLSELSNRISVPKGTGLVRIPSIQNAGGDLNAPQVGVRPTSNAAIDRLLVSQQNFAIQYAEDLRKQYRARINATTLTTLNPQQQYAVDPRQAINPNPKSGRDSDIAMGRAFRPDLTIPTAPRTPYAMLEAMYGKETLARLQNKVGQMSMNAPDQGISPINLSTLGTGASKGKLNIMKDVASGNTRLDISRELGAGTNAWEKLNVTMDQSGNIMKSTQKQYRTLGDSIIRNVAEVAKWTLAIGLVYAPMRKASEMFQEMIVNQSKLAEVQIATGASAEKMGQIFTNLADVASQTGEHVVGAIEAYRQAYQATGALADPAQRSAVATKLLTDALTLSKLAGIDEAGAIDILAGSLNQMDMPLTQGTSLMDKWVQVAKIANVDINTLATTFVTASTAADGVGLSVDKLNAVIAATSEVSAKSAVETANMVRAFISGFQSDNAKIAIQDLGIATTTASGEARDFLTIMYEIKALADAGIISNAEMTKLANILGGGARRGAQFAGFIQNVGRVDTIMKASETAQAGAAYLALGVKMATVEAQTQKLNNAFTVLAQALGGEGGVLTGGAATISMFTTLINGITTFTKLVGNATLAITALGAATLYMSRNPGAMNKMMVGKEGASGIAGMGMTGVARQLGNMYDPIAVELNQIMRKFRPSLGIGIAGQETGDYAKKLNAAGQPIGMEWVSTGTKMGQKFSDFVQRRTGAMFAGAEIAISSAFDIGSGKVAKGILGALGGLGAGALSGWNPIFMVLGQVLMNAFYEKFIGYSMDMGTALASAMVSGESQLTQKPGTSGKSRAEIAAENLSAATDELVKSIGKQANLGVETPLWLAKTELQIQLLQQKDVTAKGLNPWMMSGLENPGAGLTQTRDFREGRSKEELDLSQVPSLEDVKKMTPAQRKTKDLFGRFIYEYMNGMIPDDGTLRQEAAKALMAPDLDATKFAIIKGILEPMGTQIHKAAVLALDAYQYAQGFDISNSQITAFVNKRDESTGKGTGYGAWSEKYAKEQTDITLEQSSIGKMTALQERTRLEGIGTIGAKVAGVYTSLEDLDVKNKNVFDDMDATVSGSAEVWEKLANVIINSSQEEYNALSDYLGVVQEYYRLLDQHQKDPTKPGPTAVDKYNAIEAQKQASKLIIQTAIGQKIQAFKQPTMMEMPEGTSQAVMQQMIADAQAMQQDYFDVFVPDKDVQANMLSTFAEIGFQVGDAFQLGVAAGILDPKWLEIIKKQYEEAGKIAKDSATKNMQISKVGFGSEQFGQLDAGVAKYAALLARSFPDYKQDTTNTQGIISTDNQTKILHGDSLAIQLALQDILNVEQKQLDGIYNLPGDSSLWVPFQTMAYAKNAGGSGGGGTATDESKWGTASGRASGQINPMATGEVTMGNTPQAFDPSQWNLKQKDDPYTPPLTSSTANIGKEQTSWIDRLSQVVDSIFTKMFPVLPAGTPPEYDPDSPSVGQQQAPDLGSSLAQSLGSIVSSFSTRLNLDIKTTSQLIVDGRVLAMIIKPYLMEELVKYDSMNATTSKTVVG